MRRRVLSEADSMSVSYIHCQFSRVVPGSATLQRGFWNRARARRSQEEGTGAGLTKWTSMEVSRTLIPYAIGSMKLPCIVGKQHLLSRMRPHNPVVVSYPYRPITTVAQRSPRQSYARVQVAARRA